MTVSSQAIPEFTPSSTPTPVDAPQIPLMPAEEPGAPNAVFPRQSEGRIAWLLVLLCIGGVTAGACVMILSSPTSVKAIEEPREAAATTAPLQVVKTPQQDAAPAESKTGAPQPKQPQAKMAKPPTTAAAGTVSGGNRQQQNGSGSKPAPVVRVYRRPAKQ